MCRLRNFIRSMFRSMLIFLSLTLILTQAQSQKTFTAWWGIYSPRVARYTNSDYSSVLAWQELFKKTGVTIKFYHPPVGQETDNFRLMIASQEIPDLIYAMVNTGTGTPLYPGGWDKAIEEGVIIRLNELIDKYMPNLRKLIRSKPEIRKSITSDKGNIYFLPMVITKWLPWGGLQVRKDWLDELGLKEPITYDDWYKMLKLFKEKKGAVMQLLYTGYHMYDLFNAGYGIGTGFYQVGGKVKFGPLEPGFLQYLTMMNKWYKEGLIDKDFYANRQYFPDDNSIISGKYGAWMASWRKDYYKGISKDPKFDILAVSPPVRKVGDKIHIGKLTFKPLLVDIMGLFITTRCKDPITVVKFFDYLYTKEGQIFADYGIEGVTFKYVDGKPIFTDLITSVLDPNYKSKYLISAAPGIRDGSIDIESNPAFNKEELTYVYKQKWSSSDMKWELPDWLTFTTEEGSKLSKIMADVNTFIEETVPKFIIGNIPLSQYKSSFIDKLKALGIEEAIKIYQNAYDRYRKR
ncbi:MAG: extracellular solute-binding protein [Candidatus Pacearchaeota archaeon]